MALISFSTTSLRRYRAFRENYCFCFVEGRRSENGLQFFSAKSSWSNPHTLNTDVLRMPDRGTSSSRGKFSTTQAQTYDFQTQNQLPEPERKISMTASHAVLIFRVLHRRKKIMGSKQSRTCRLKNAFLVLSQNNKPNDLHSTKGATESFHYIPFQIVKHNNSRS